MKRFIAVLSGLLVLPAFAEVAPVYYDEIVEYTDDMIDAVEDDIVEEETTKEISPKVAPRTNVIGRSTSHVVPTGNSTTSRTNTSTRAVASSPRKAKTTTSRGTVSRATKKAATSVVARTPAKSANTSRTSARSATVTSRTSARSAKPVTARVSTTGSVMAGTRASTVATTTLKDSGNSLYNSNARVSASVRRPTARVSTSGLVGTTSPIITNETVSSTADTLAATAELTEYCKAQYASCMDNYCNVLDDNQGRCSCSKNIKNYAATENALKESTEKFQDVVQQISYIGLTDDQIIALYQETEAEATIKKQNKGNSAFEQELNRIRTKGLVDASSPKSSSSSNLSSGFEDFLDFDFTSGDAWNWTSFLSGTTGNGSVSNQRGEQLYKTASARCKASVLNSCTDQGIDAKVITNSYDLEIDKQCIAYERSLNDANDEMRTNARNAATVLQRARLKLAQLKNSYDLRGCVAALDECMQDEYVCGDEYKSCLDPTGKYIANGALIPGSMPGIAGGASINVQERNLSNKDTWTSGGMHDLYSVWDYASGTDTLNAWGAGVSENLTNFIDAKVTAWNPANKTTRTASDIATDLLKKVGYIDGDKPNGMCAAVLKQCQDYTYDNKTNLKDRKYQKDNAVIRQYLANALATIKLKQDEIISDYAENCKSEVTSCLNTNGYDSDKSESNSVNIQAIRACSTQITTCMSVTGYKPSDPSQLTYQKMSEWTADMLNYDEEEEATDDNDNGSGTSNGGTTNSGESTNQNDGGSTNQNNGGSTNTTTCPIGYACANGQQTACEGATYSDTTGLSECKICPKVSGYTLAVAVNEADIIYDYSGTGLHTSIDGCVATFTYPAQTTFIELEVPLNFTCGWNGTQYGDCTTKDEIRCTSSAHFNPYLWNASNTDKNRYVCDTMCRDEYEYYQSTGDSNYEYGYTESARFYNRDHEGATFPDIASDEFGFCQGNAIKDQSQTKAVLMELLGLSSEQDRLDWCSPYLTEEGYKCSK